MHTVTRIPTLLSQISSQTDTCRVGLVLSSYPTHMSEIVCVPGAPSMEDRKQIRRQDLNSSTEIH